MAAVSYICFKAQSMAIEFPCMSDITDNREIAPGAWVLSFPKSFEFKAGQVIGLGLETKGEPRFYSIASGENDPLLQVLYTVNPEGMLTPGLSRLKKGNAIYHTRAFGKFTAAEKASVWIATGTGVAPFLSMMRSGITDGNILIQGNRSPERLFFSDEISELMGKAYHPCTSRVKADNMFFGRVTDYLQNNNLYFPDKPYYLCGNAEMVVEVRDLLISRGIPFGNIMAEIFF